MDPDLKGRTAIVTGGSKGIGYAVARALRQAGANVAICARRAGEVERAAAELGVLGVPCDMRQPDQVQGLVDRTVEEFGGLDILVNNAGVGAFIPVDRMTIEDWHSMLDTNLTGVFYACHAAVPKLKERSGGWIINVASLAGKNPLAGGAAYNASKFGLVGFSEATMLDLRHYGIRVSCLMPGSVATHFGNHEPGEADAWKIQPEDIGQIVLDLLAMNERTLPSRVEIRPTRPPRS